MAEASRDENPKVVRMPIDPAQIQSVGVGGVQFNTQTILQSPFFWFTIGAVGAWFVIYSIGKQKK